MPTPPPPHPRSGFTLIEMAIVLVVIGLIVGMVFKGRQLIDQGRVKKAAAQYYKIVGAIETFYDRYGFYPGDGCGADSNYDRNNPNPLDCNNPKRGYVHGNSFYPGSREANAFWELLIDGTGILSESDRESVFGQPWHVLGRDVDAGGLPAQTTWLDLHDQGRFDKRTVCALDQMIDDGHRSTGFVIDIHPGNYTPETDCWSLTGQGRIHIRVLP